MRIRIEDIDRLILDIHAAPLDDSNWQRIVDDMTRMVGADQSMLFSVPMQLCNEFWHVLSQVDPQMPQDYASEFSPEDPWALAARRLPVPMTGRIVTGDELIVRREFLRTRFYNDFAAQYDLDQFMCLLLCEPPFPGAPPAAAFSLYRRKNSTAFGALEQEILSRLAPHLVVALKTFFKIESLSMSNLALRDGLDSVTAAIFIVDRIGRVIYENRAGQRLLSTGECLRLVEGRLAPTDSIQEKTSCRDALEGLLQGRCTAVRLTIGMANRTVILSTSPFSASTPSAAAWQGAAGLVWLVPTTTTLNAVTRIANMFALTAAEQRLLASLSAGSSVAEAANSLHLSIHTTRNQLKAIQHKTGWRKQGELLRMVQQLCVISPAADG
jgi:DNA-binding CsgD family transcriptional regulator/PAS domain-containing protein